jgi:release factor glutamine methyltransferase
MTPPGPRLDATLAAAAARLRDAGVEDPRRDARLLAARVLDLAPGAVLTRGDRILSVAEAQSLEALVARRAQREPISRILGRRGFWTLDLALGPDTLDPRPDTGCILLALLSERSQATGLGVDIAPGALAVARDNARALGLDDRVTFQQGNWAAGLTGPFDLVVSNPPYIPAGDLDGLEPEVTRFDPRRALDGGPDGLDPYRILARECPPLLAGGGALAVEFGQGQEDDVAAILAAGGLAMVERRRDLAGIVRCSLHRLPPLR